MTRLCVKNIGKGTTESQIRTLFASKGEVTDVKIIKTKSGKSREFAFVGFRNDEQASTALSYFNHSYIGTSKIQIEIAEKLTTVENIAEKSSSIRSRHSKQKIEKFQKEKDKEARAHAVANPIVAKAPAAATKALSKEMQEFQQVMQRGQVGSVWDNDMHAQVDTIEKVDSANKSSKDGKRGSESDSDSDSDDESVNDMTQSQLNPDDSDGDEDLRPASKKAFDSNVSDLDFLKSKISKNLDRDGDSDLDSDADYNDDDDDNDDEEEKMNNDINKEDDVNVVTDAVVDDEEEVEDSGRLFVRNIPYTCDEEELRRLFEPHGELSGVHIPVNKQSRSKPYGESADGISVDEDSAGADSHPDQMSADDTEFDAAFALDGGKSKHGVQYNKGFAFVQFLFPESARKALAVLDGCSFQGRLLHIIMAKHKKEETGVVNVNEHVNDKDGKQSSYQKKLEADRKKLMNRVEGWNSSYIRTDAAIDALAQTYGVSSSEIMNTDKKSAGELAVAMAVSENHMIQQNKEYFAKQGIDLGVLESSMSSSKAKVRSTTALLIKNLKFEHADENELENMFAKFGPIAQFLMPPNKSVGYVEFMEATTARTAFKHMSYKRYHNMPLYLEWAPLRVGGAVRTPISVDKSKSDTAASSSANKSAHSGSDADATGTIYVKNLNFKTTADDIRLYLTSTLKCCQKSDIRGVVIPTKSIVSTGGSSEGNAVQLSMGYGFIELSSSVSIQSVMEKLQGAVLNGHKLEAKLSQKKLEAVGTVKKRELVDDSSANNVSTKLIIRNLAFQTTVEELKKLCSVYGSIKTIRLPKKGVNANNSTINQHRGFAFVEYHSKKEAELAFQQLKLIHLYGRHLVCEYASTSDMNDATMNNSGLDSMSSAGTNAKSLKSLRDKVKQDMQSISRAATNQRGSKRQLDDGLGDGMDAYSKGSKFSKTGSLE